MNRTLSLNAARDTQGVGTVGSPQIGIANMNADRERDMTMTINTDRLRKLASHIARMTLVPAAYGIAVIEREMLETVKNEGEVEPIEWFDMRQFAAISEREDESGYPEHCGTVACVAGNTVALFAVEAKRLMEDPHAPHGVDDIESIARILLGLDHRQSSRLFIPTMYGTTVPNLGHVTPKQAAYVLRHVADQSEFTQDVDVMLAWKSAMEPTNPINAIGEGQPGTIDQGIPTCQCTAQGICTDCRRRIDADMHSPGQRQGLPTDSDYIKAREYNLRGAIRNAQQAERYRSEHKFTTAAMIMVTLAAYLRGMGLDWYAYRNPAQPVAYRTAIQGREDAGGFAMQGIPAAGTISRADEIGELILEWLKQRGAKVVGTITDRDSGADFVYYEDPIHGDESRLIGTRGSLAWRSEHCDMPDLEEAQAEMERVFRAFGTPVASQGIPELPAGSAKLVPAGPAVPAWGEWDGVRPGLPGDVLTFAEEMPGNEIVRVNGEAVGALIKGKDYAYYRDFGKYMPFGGGFGVGGPLETCKRTVSSRFSYVGSEDEDEHPDVVEIVHKAKSEEWTPTDGRKRDEYIRGVRDAILELADVRDNVADESEIVRETVDNAIEAVGKLIY